MSPLAMLRSLLSSPEIYVRFQRAVWGKAMRELVTNYVRPQAGQRLLDMGCGPADIVRLLPVVDYVGFDHSARYIEAARRRFGGRANFILADVASVPTFPAESYDIVLAKGLVHHIDDSAAERLFRLAANALRPTGKLITVDACFHDGQSTAHRRLTGMDRGEYIRRPGEYRGLGEEFFADIEIDVRDDLLRIPYSLAIGVFTR
jgi:SAM-dependent methyltransferase